MTHRVEDAAIGGFAERYWKKAVWMIGSLNLINRRLPVALVLAAAWLYEPRTTVMAQTPHTPLTPQTAILVPYYKPPFVIRNYGGKCLDFGPPPQVTGTPVFINDCTNGTVGQEVRIEEVNAQHDVILRAGTKVIGVKSEMVDRIATPSAALAGAHTEAETPLELQDEKNRNTVYALPQIFALDGDSIMLASNRKRVVKVQNAAGRNRTPIVLGTRNLADAEFWTFTATDHSGIRPTSGFVPIVQVDDFEDGGELRARLAFLDALRNAKWGTVIEVHPNVSIKLTNVELLHIPAGVTIRGDRRGPRPGPLLTAFTDQSNVRSTHFPNSDVGLFIINGDHVRITGLRMRGPSRAETALPYAAAIAAQDKFISIVDHNEIFDWTTAAVTVNREPDDLYAYNRDASSRQQNLRVVRNFIHHCNNGYGVVTYGGAYPFIEGNTFISNRHSIAAGSDHVQTAYKAWSNLSLSAVPSTLTSDFDAHGTGLHGFGGSAGQYFEIAGNTFLGTNRENFILRGTPTGWFPPDRYHPARYPSVFHHNVSLLSQSDAVSNIGDPGGLVVTGNQFGAPNPTSRLAVGDFDGDGIQDLFLATGNAWYYAPAGTAEWRFINAQPDGIGNLLFGDFDNDRRTDVFTQHGYSWDVSWGGVSKWETINVSGSILGNAAVGNFIGDQRDDIFYSDGGAWYASDGGTGSFTLLADSDYRVPDLRFGDFNADGKTDVFRVASVYWEVSYGGMSFWQPLRPKLTDSVADLVVADFNGDGRADVATSTRSLLGWAWKVSHSGWGNWTTLRTTTVPLSSAVAVGRFAGNAGADVLLWHSNYLGISAGGAGAAVRHSRQDVDLR